MSQHELTVKKSPRNNGVYFSKIPVILLQTQMKLRSCCRERKQEGVGQRRFREG